MPHWNRGIAKIDGTLRAFSEHTVSADDIEPGPCDAVLVTEDGATLTGIPTDIGGAAAAGPPLAANVWHPMSFQRITAVSAGDVWIAWLRLTGE